MSLLKTPLALAAAVALALGGAGVAAAQAYDDHEFDSPSEIDTTGRGAETTVTYTNRTDHTLTCVVHVGDPEIVNALHVDSAPGDGPLDDETLLSLIDEAMESGRLALAMGDVPPQETAEIPFLFSLTDDSFDPISWGTCSGHGSDYGEVEIDVPEVSSGSLGSIDVFGSLGGGSGSLSAAPLDR
ncbi:hypothetical protein [Dietzia psychralcaliphila]|uniref:hypothetical protein n=1 Tax=Dietzia psychralcaliphila TaxID=139021 RepID=UPI001C1E3765|nr:hypothetical protein [Dietzia psychralcaliphila]